MSLSVGLRRTAALSLLAQGAHAAPLNVHAPKLRTEDELDGNAEEIETGSKPRRSGTTGIKGLQLDRFVSATEESRTSSPESQEFGSVQLERDTRRLLQEFYRIQSGLSPPDSRSHSALPTLTRVVQDILDKHRITYKGMVQRLHLESQSDDMDFISNIANKMFSDGSTNWGRITSLVAFGAVMCVRLKELHRENCVDRVAEQISSFLISEQQDWLINNKGWIGFVEFFRVDDMESVVRNALMAFAGVAGISAGLAFLIR